MGWITRLICAVIGAAALATTTPWDLLNWIMWFVGAFVALVPVTLLWPAKRGEE